MKLFLIRVHEMTALVIAANDLDTAKREVLGLLFWPEALDTITPPEMRCKELGKAMPGTEAGVIFRGDCIRLAVREDKPPVLEAACRD